MNYKGKGLLGLSVIVLMTLWRQVFPAPVTSCSSDFESIKRLTGLLDHEAKTLQSAYTSHFGHVRGSAPSNIPNSSISGLNIFEQLRDISLTFGLFKVHLAKVDEYQREILESPQSIAVPLLHVRDRLPMSEAMMRAFLQDNKPEMVPPTPAPPEVFHQHDYLKRRYSQHVIFRLKDCLAEVVRVVEGADGVCDQVSPRASVSPSE